MDGAQETREEHLKWCKERALEYCELGKPGEVLASLASDLSKHPETAGHAAIQLGVRMAMSGMLNTPERMRKFVEDMN